MSYIPNTWEERKGTGLNRFQDQNGNIYNFTSIPTEVIQQGTPFSAKWMNHLEQGVAAAVSSDEKGTANGIATLNEHTQLPLSQLPFAYEVGTWTPKLTNYAWNYTGAETVKAATYVKIGRMVTVNAYVSISTVGSGNLMLTGLPFSSLANQDGVFSWILGNNDSINGGVRYHGHARSQGRSMSLFQGNGMLGGNLLAIGNHLVVTGSYMVE